jgi:phospholipid/cholesterol/gamma-HCH transport system substrate-binding protein
MERPAVPESRIPHLRIKVGLLLAAFPVLLGGLVLYALYARGVFEPTRDVTLISRDAEGLGAGVPVMFSGFPIGEVRGIQLTEDGLALVQLRIVEKDARWLRRSSVFSFEKQLFGKQRIRVSSPRMQDPPLPLGAVLALRIEDATQNLPELVNGARSVIDDLRLLTRPGSNLTLMLADLRAVAARLNGDYGLMGGLTGSPERARAVLDASQRINRLVTSLDGVAMRMDAFMAKSDRKVLGEGGLVDDAKRSTEQANVLLGEVRDSLKRADEVLANAQAASANARVISENVKESTTDLARLRAEVDENVQKVNRMLVEINRKWPLARDSRVRLP